MSQPWTDLVVGARMRVDQEFSERVAASPFSNQQWSLVMTAVDFEIEQPADPAAARIVADTSKLPSVLPEMENIESQMHAMAAGRQPDSAPGILDRLKASFGLGSGGGDLDPDRLEKAETLAQAYAEELQAHLESNDRWDEVRTAASE